MGKTSTEGPVTSENQKKVGWMSGEASQRERLGNSGMGRDARHWVRGRRLERDSLGTIRDLCLWEVCVC